MQEQRQTLFARLETLLDQDHDYVAAARVVRALMFVERFAHDVGERRAALEQ
jgi:molecular chaperone HscB